MGIKPRVKALSHMFMPGHTVTSAIKQINLYDVTKEEMPELLENFKKMNGDTVPRPGERVLIPVLARHPSVTS